MGQPKGGAKRLTIELERTWSLDCVEVSEKGMMTSLNRLKWL
jgi:hypothetical protein